MLPFELLDIVMASTADANAQHVPSAAAISGMLVALLSLDDGLARFERLLHTSGCPVDLQPGWRALARHVHALIEEYSITPTMARAIFFELAPAQARAFFDEDGPSQAN